MEEKQNRKAVTGRRARNVVISTAILLVFLVSGGVVYTWYMDQSGPQSTATKATTEITEQTPIKPTAPSASTQESAAIEYLTTPVAPGDSASVNVKTVAASNCTISVMYNSVASTDPGLKPKVADNFGNVSWNWTVGKNTPVGTWPVKVTCVRQAKSAVVQGDFQVAK